MKIQFLLALLLSCATSKADWPEFRGPNADGTVTGNLPTEWSEDKNITWRKKIEGLGWSTPVVKDGKIWITTAAIDGTTMSLLCFDYVNGDTLVDRILITNDNPEPLGNKMNSYASCSPILKGNRIYVSFGSYGTFCIDTKTFETIWHRRDIKCSHWRGPASSPIIWNDKLILTFDGTDQQFLMALDIITGDTVWRKDRSTLFADERKGIPANSGDMRKAYSTPIVVTSEGKDTLVSNAAKSCWAYDPDNGEELWHVKYKTHSPSSRTIFSAQENLLYINTGLGKAEVWAIRVDQEAKGDITDSHVVWKALKRTPKRSSPVIANGLLFFANDGVGSCVDPATGELYWSERIGGDYSASLLAVTGDEQPPRVYFFDEDGLCTVVNATKVFEKVSENHLDAGFMASPSAYRDSLLLRTRTHLYRIDD
jgi:outer membrane protein assembly factor BamB